MIINLLKLKTGELNEILIDNKINIDKEYYENTDIRNISDVFIKGKIVDHNEDEYEILLNIKTTLTLPCSVTLEDVKYEINTDIDEFISEYSENMEENYKIMNNSIDLIPIIWQNILLEVPLKVTSEGIDRSTLRGDGWKLVTTEEELKDEIDPRLEKFKDFL